MGFPKVHVYNGSAEIKVDTGRFKAQYSRAQKWLDNEVIVDSTPYVPFLNSDLRKSAIRGTELGSGEVIWANPYARYQYYGKLMIGPPPKELTDIPLQYHQPGTGAFWFETAKSTQKRHWIDGVRKLAGGG